MVELGISEARNEKDRIPRLSGSGLFNLMMRKGGLEPPRPCGHWHLKPARLPIPPLPRRVLSREPEMAVGNSADCVSALYDGTSEDVNRMSH